MDVNCLNQILNQKKQRKKNKMFECRKVIKVEYAHQLYSSYTAACHETIHGHSGVIELIFDSPYNDHDGMVIDFGEISDNVKPMLMDRYDHALFMSDQFDDQYIGTLMKYNKKLRVVPGNPTAEYFAEEIFKMVSEYMLANFANYSTVTLKKVIFHETDTGYATYSE